MATDTATQPANAYVLGHDDAELERLARQASLFSDITRELLVRAGISPGMRVLDIGCGVGDVSMILADLVGPTGSVLAIDPAAAAVQTARRRLGAAGKPWVEFAVSDLQHCGDLSGFDAAAGRFILIHMPDAAETITDLARRMRVGAHIAFIEFDLTSAGARPTLPLLQTCIDWIIEVYRRSGRDPDTGTGMYSAFRAAGIAPDMLGMTRISDNNDALGLGFVAESVRSLAPAIEALGIADANTIGLPTLLQRLLDEAAGADRCILYPRVVGAWGRAAGQE